MSKSSDAPDRVYHLLPISQAARRLNISTRLFKEAVERGQIGAVRLLQIGARQYVHAGLFFDHIEASRHSKG